MSLNPFRARLVQAQSNGDGPAGAYRQVVSAGMLSLTGPAIEWQP